MSRAHFGLQYDPNHEQVFLYGGLTREAVLGDFWARVHGEWSELDFTGPGTRSHLGMAYDTNRNELLIFGGATGDATFATVTNDTWLLTGGRWQELTPASAPSARGGAGLGYDGARERFVLYGGFDSTGADLDDAWEFDGSDWTCLAGCP